MAVTNFGGIQLNDDAMNSDAFVQDAPKVLMGGGAPTISAPKGTLYINRTGAAADERLYINTDGSTTWASFTASA